MSDAPTQEKAASCPPRCSIKCAICCIIMALVVIAIGSGIHAQWTAWARYKKFSADTYSIIITAQDGSKVEAQPGSYVKVFRVYDRVDIIKNDKSHRRVFYAPKGIEIRKK